MSQQGTIAAEISTPRAVRAPALPSLTGLRYLAAAAVVMCHSSQVLGSGTVSGDYTGIGYIGVEFFFVLSGFVLTWSHDPAVSKATFYRRRFARIYPMYIVTWVGVVAAAQAFNMPNQSLIGAALGVVLLQAYFPQQEIFQAGNTPGWSLSAEAFFYGLFPFLVTRLPKWRGATLAIVVLVTLGGIAYGLSSIYSVWFAYYSPFFGIIYFFIGMTLARHVRNPATWLPPLSASLSLLFAAFLLAGAFLADQSKGLVEAVLLPLIVLVIVTAGRADMKEKRTLWSRSITVTLGQWSFAVYLLHWGLLGLASRFVDVPLGEFQSLLAGIAVLIVTTLAAGVAYVALERPAERWIRGRSRPREAAAQAADPM